MQMRDDDQRRWQARTTEMIAHQRVPLEFPDAIRIGLQPIKRIAEAEFRSPQRNNGLAHLNMAMSRLMRRTLASVMYAMSMMKMT